MHPKFFGESHDIAKRRIMRWLAPHERWAAHPMWFEQRPGSPRDRAFLKEYATALDVDIVKDESRDREAFLAAAKACCRHLLLDPDTGMSLSTSRRNSRKHVRVDQFIQIVKSPSRPDKLTLIYDQSYLRNGVDIWEQTRAKLRCLDDAEVYAVAYMAHEGSRVRFIWASTDREAIAGATRRIRSKPGFPRWRCMSPCNLTLE